MCHEQTSYKNHDIGSVFELDELGCPLKTTRLGTISDGGFHAPRWRPWNTLGDLRPLSLGMEKKGPINTLCGVSASVDIFQHVYSPF